MRLTNNSYETANKVGDGCAASTPPKAVRVVTWARALAVLRLSAKRFVQINGGHWAEAFAFNALFAIFPLIILLVTLTSLFVDRDNAANTVIAYIEKYARLNGAVQHQIFEALAGIVRARERAGALAFFALLWTAQQCFSTLVQVTNSAWELPPHKWWRLPLRGLMLLGTTAAIVLVGMVTPLLAGVASAWFFPHQQFGSSLYGLFGFLLPLSLRFASLCLLYRLAPGRRTRFTEVWVGAFCATTLLQMAETLFIVYLGTFATFNAVYGALGGIMALMLWIYVSGCLFIFGACICAAQHELSRSWQGLGLSSTK